MKAALSFSSLSRQIFFCALTGLFLGAASPAMASAGAADGVSSPDVLYEELQNQVTGPDVHFALLSEVQPAVRQTLMQIASLQSDFWSDGILEGEYEAAGDTRLDRVEAVYKGTQLVAYHITYSQTGWFTGKCDYDSRDKNTLVGCSKGHITESSYVSPDFKVWISDAQNFAQFRD